MRDFNTFKSKNNTFWYRYLRVCMLTLLILCSVAVQAQENDEDVTAPGIVSVQGFGNFGQIQLFSLPDALLRTGISSWQQTNFRGAGQRIGVLDRGFGGILEFETSFNTEVKFVLPDADKDQEDSNEIRHGRNVLEVIHRVAPEAELFACSYANLDDFRLCIDYMIANDIKIINHSAGVPALPLDGTNLWAREVDRAAAAGILWVNSAGNFASGYMTDYYTDTNANSYHEFRGVGINEMLSVDTALPARGRVFLSWEGTATLRENEIDFDLEIVDTNTGEILYSSTQPQQGNFDHEALEYVSVPLERPFGIRIRNADGISEQIRLVLFVEFATLPAGGQGGSIIAPADSQNALAVGALQGNVIAPYSSRGPISSGALKPDLVTLGEFQLASGEQFVGTSAAAPVVAGLAALIWEANPNWEREQLFRYIRDSATRDDVQIAGPDSNYGMGVLFINQPDIAGIIQATEPPVPTEMPNANHICPGALPAQLTAGSTGIVQNRDDSKINVRVNSGSRNQRIDQLVPLQTFRVLAGPVCEDGFNWYQVDYGTGVGWIAEGMYDDRGNEFYFVQVLDEQARAELERAQGISCDIAAGEEFDAQTELTWYLGSGAASTISIQNGAYTVRLEEASRRSQPVSWGSIQDFQLGENARVVAEFRGNTFSNSDDRAGLWLEYVDSNEFIAFTIRSDGAFQIAQYQYGYIPVVDWMVSPAINTGDNVSNTLEIIKQGTSYDVYINNEFVTGASISDAPQGSIAFFGASWDVPTRFLLDRIRICSN